MYTRERQGLLQRALQIDPVQHTCPSLSFSIWHKFVEKIYEALFAYYEPETWRKIQRNGMTVDNSWENAARKYIRLYQMAKA